MNFIGWVYSTCFHTLTEATLETHIRPVWVRNGALHQTSTLGSSQHTTWHISLFTGLSCCGSLFLYRFGSLSVSIPLQLTQGTVVGCSDGVWMGRGQYSPGCDSELCRYSRTALFDWAFRSWLCSWGCFVPILLLSSIRDGLSIWPFHFVFSNRQLFCLCTSIWYRPRQKLSHPVATIIYHR